MNAEQLEMWLVKGKEFKDRPGPYLAKDNDFDDWVLEHGDGPTSPKEFADAILEFINQSGYYV